MSQVSSCSQTTIVRPNSLRAAFFTAANASGRIWSKVSPAFSRAMNSSVFARSCSSVRDWYESSISLMRVTIGAHAMRNFL